MLKIRQIDHLVLRVTDLKAMLDFYISVLGCSLDLVQEEIGLYQLRAGTSLIDLVPVHGPLGRVGGPAPAAAGRNLDHFCLRLESFDETEIVSYLRGKGVSPGDVASRFGAEGLGPSIYVNDPEGNVVELKGPPWDQVMP